MTLSNIINKALTDFDKDFIYNGGFTDEEDAKLGNSLREKAESFLTKCITEAYEAGREEEMNGIKNWLFCFLSEKDGCDPSDDYFDEQLKQLKIFIKESKNV